MTASIIPLTTSITSLKDAKDKDRENPRFVRDAIKLLGADQLQYADDGVKKDRKTVLLAISIDPDAYKWADDSLKNNRKFQEKCDILSQKGGRWSAFKDPFSPLFRDKPAEELEDQLRSEDQPESDSELEYEDETRGNFSPKLPFKNEVARSLPPKSVGPALTDDDLWVVEKVVYKSQKVPILTLPDFQTKKPKETAKTS